MPALLLTPSSLAGTRRTPPSQRHSMHAAHAAGTHPGLGHMRDTYVVAGAARVFSPPSCSAQPTSGRYHRPNRGSQEVPRRYRRNEAPQQRTAPCVPAPRRWLTADRRGRGAVAERHRCTGMHRRLSDVRSAAQISQLRHSLDPFTDHRLTSIGRVCACEELNGRKYIQCSPTVLQCADGERITATDSGICYSDSQAWELGR